MFRKNRSSRGYALATGFAVLVACSSSTGLEVVVDGQDGESVDITPLLTHFGAEVEVAVDGGEIVIRADGVPNHPSPYFQAGDPRYEAYNGSNPNFRPHPNRIAESEVTHTGFRARPRERAACRPLPSAPSGSR